MNERGTNESDESTSSTLTDPIGERFRLEHAGGVEGTSFDEIRQRSQNDDRYQGFAFALRPEDHQPSGHCDFNRIYYPETKVLSVGSRWENDYKEYEAKREDIMVDGELVYRYQFANGTVLTYTSVKRKRREGKCKRRGSKHRFKRRGKGTNQNMSATHESSPCPEPKER